MISPMISSFLLSALMMFANVSLISTEVDAEHGKIIEAAIQLIISNYVKDYL